MNRKTIFIAIYFAILFITSETYNRQVYAMQENSGTNIRDTGEGFGVVYHGGHGYGWNNVGIWLSGKIRIGLSDTIRDGDISGVGIIDAQLSPDDLREAKEIHRQLCVSVDRKSVHETPMRDPSRTYDVDCLREGKVVSHQGMMDDLPEDVHSSMYSFYQRVRRMYVGLGRAVVKLDAEVVTVQRDSGKLLVSVRFLNGGRYPIKMRRPDQWSTEEGNRLSVGGKSGDGSDYWGAELAGLPLVKGSETATEIITLAAGTSIMFHFLAIPNGKILRGKYDAGLLVAMDASASDVAPSLGYVDFHSDNKKHLQVTFDRDYPSTPEELENYEAYKREQMSSRPVYPRSTFSENGYYRAVSEFSRQRSRFVTRFHKGDIAPEAEGVIDENGEPIHDRLVAWFWEADPGLPPYGTDVVCRPGKACPRSGRWFERKQLPYPMFPVTYDDSSNRVIHCRAGETMPGIIELSSHGLSNWEWIGI